MFPSRPSDDSGTRFLPANLTARIVRMDSSEVLRCPVSEFDEECIRIEAPVACGLSVGQRYEVIFADSPEAERFARLVGDAHYVTVLQTEVRPSPQGAQLGINMRFDQPLML